MGLVMFALALVLIILAGVPVYAVLIGVSSIFAALGLALGLFDTALLGAVPSRLVGLLEHDLLQALPLYALVGAMLNRLPLAQQLHAAGMRLFRRSAASAELAALGVGALLAPMNGSVGASLHMLSRSVAPALEGRCSPAQAGATVCVASTLGIAIAPSLVLLLLGDAMMRAHTEAQNVTHTMLRIVNTQDVMRAALVPAALVLLSAMAIAAWRGLRRAQADLSATQTNAHASSQTIAHTSPQIARQVSLQVSPPMRTEAGLHEASASYALPLSTWLAACTTALVIVLLLAGVAVGRLYAVEAAATGCVLLFAYALLSGQLRAALMAQVLRDSMALTGVLMALLVAATTFSLVLRAYGTDALIAQALQAWSGRPMAMLLIVFSGLVACSFVLDAFEMIFLVIPLVMPPLLMTVPDPAWVAALTLLVLQLGFLLPPFGYAVLMSRSLLHPAPNPGLLARALVPHLLAQAVLIVAVLSWPQMTRWTRPDPPAATAGNTPEQAERLLQQAIEAQQNERVADTKPDPTGR